MKVSFLIQTGFSLFLLCASGPGRAELTVDITRGIQGLTPIAIVPFGQPDMTQPNIGSIVAADLARSGRFNPMPESQLPERPVPPSGAAFAAWQAAGQEHLVIGRMIPSTDGNTYEAEFQLLDVTRSTVTSSQKIGFKRSELRHAAHRIADIVYQQLTGDRGVFNTRIALVSASGSGKGREYRLQIADSDGFDARTVTSSPEPILSPAWAPDGKRIAYVSFEHGSPAIYIQDLPTGQRQKMTDFPGINGAPAWSPDGARLALTLSKDGSPDICVLDVATRTVRRLTTEDSIETEAAWSPDGQNLLFTSDRGGKPELYQMSALGGEAHRLTYEGDYNVRGVYAPDGRRLAMVHGGSDGYRIALLDMASHAVQILSPGRLDDSPAFSPDGRMILYVSHGNEGDRLTVVTPDGKTRQDLQTPGGEVRSAAWSPWTP